MVLCTNSEFLARVFGDCAGYGWVCAFPGNPGDPSDSRWYGRPLTPSAANAAIVDAWQDQNTYFGIAELRESEPGRRARKRENFVRLRALPVDDFIADDLHGVPTWVLETSPGKFQVGIIISRTDPDAADPALVEALMAELYRRKFLGDNSGNNLVRYVRLPVGTNGKPRDSGPFQHRLHTWNPDQVLSLADACAVFGIDLDEVRKTVKSVSTDAVIFGDVSQDELMAECMHRVINNIDYHESLNRIGSSLSASGMHPGAQVNFLRGLMNSCQSPRKDTWQDRYNDIPRAVETAWKKFGKPSIAPLAEPGEPEDKKPLLVRYGDLPDTLEPPNWLIRGWLEVGCMSMMYGPPGTGKSFATLDMACCVATGTPWRGLDVQQGPVVIVVGEGEGGIKRRLKAWEKKTGVSLKDAPLYMTRRSVQFLNPAAAAELVAAIDAVVETMAGELPAMVAIDTVARNFGPGDENSTEDATAFIECLDALIRRRYGCHVLLVHHTGKDATAGARGSSVFKASMDQMFSISPKAYGNLIQLEAKKMKDGEDPKPMNFRLEKIILGEDSYGEPISSAFLESVANEYDETIVEGEKGPISVGKVLALRDGEFLAGRERIAETLGLGVRQSRTVIERLQARGLIEVSPGQTARKKLTEKAMLLLSRAGDLLRDGPSEGDEGDEK